MLSRLEQVRSGREWERGGGYPMTPGGVRIYVPHNIFSHKRALLKFFLPTKRACFAGCAYGKFRRKLSSKILNK
jgi:hypothetical protein